MFVYEEMAKCFRAEGVTTHFGLMGDGNMHFMAAMDSISDTRSIGVRHEHCALLMAVGFWNMTGKPGVCSVTHGPGFTQLMTGLTTAARNNAPIVVMAGETGIGVPWNIQSMDQATLARACGAAYLEVHSPKVLHFRIREAFYLARTEKKPVVLGVPLDLQKAKAPDFSAYQPSVGFLPPTTPFPPDPNTMLEIAERLMAAKAPMLVAGRGAVLSGAGPAIEDLADEMGAILGTSLLGKGLFDHNEFSVGIVGGYISEAGRSVADQVDLVLAFGAQLSRFTVDGGKLFSSRNLVQIDIAPNALKEGLIVAETTARSDAKLAAESILALVRQSPGRRPASVRTQKLARALSGDPADSFEFNTPADVVDPRAFFAALEAVMPREYHLCSGAAHQAYWHTAMRGSPGGNYHAVRAFGAIGNSLSFATGVAVACGDGRVVLSDGDGGLLMHIQELETLARENIKLLIICINDGAFGAEIHKLRADGVPDEGAIFGATPMAKIAESFGLGAATITDPAQVADLFLRFENDDRAWLWDVKVSDQQQSPPMRANLANKGK